MSEDAGGHLAEAIEGDVWIDRIDLGQAGGDEGRIAAGGDDFWFAGEFGADLREDFPDQSAVADDGADLHGVDSGFANGGGGLGEFDLWKQGGFSGKVARHRAEAGGDDAAAVGGLGGNDVEGDGGAEIDDDGGDAVAGEDAGGVGEAVRANLCGQRVVDAHAERALVIEEMKWEFRLEVGLEDRGFFRDDGANYDRVEVDFREQRGERVSGNFSGR